MFKLSKANSLFQNGWIASNIPLCCYPAQTSHQCFLLLNCDSIRKYRKTNSFIRQIPQMPFKNRSCSLTLDQFCQIFQYQSKAADLFLEPLLQMELQSMS